MKIIHSFTMRVLMIMVSLLLLFCAVSTIAWYRSFTQEAVETAEEHMDTVIETLNEMFDEKLREIDYTTAFISNKVRTTQNDSIIQFLTASEPNNAGWRPDSRHRIIYLTGAILRRIEWNGNLWTGWKNLYLWNYDTL